MLSREPGSSNISSQKSIENNNYPLRRLPQTSNVPPKCFLILLFLRLQSCFMAIILSQHSIQICNRKLGKEGTDQAQAAFQSNKDCHPVRSAIWQIVLVRDKDLIVIQRSNRLAFDILRLECGYGIAGKYDLMQISCLVLR